MKVINLFKVPQIVQIIYIINDGLAKGNLQAEAFIKIYDVDAMKVDQASSQE